MSADSEQTNHAGRAASGEGSSSYSRSEYEFARLKLPDPLFLALHANIGRRVARKYRLKQLLGSGGMGAVYRAVHEITGGQVAVKMPLPLRPYSQGIEARFVREAQAGARIGRHPNVVDVYDLEREAGERGGPEVFLIMELLHGASLADRLSALRRSEQWLSPAELLEIMIPVSRGVAAAHARGIIHRDLKPGNIYLCRAADGGRLEPKVLDFGICKILDRENQPRTLTEPGGLLGTYFYMSDEQEKDASSVDERADVYALGVTMYEALTGRRPAGDEGDATALARRISKSARRREPRIPAALGAVVLRAMEKRAEDRHPSVEALLEDLLHCQRARWRGTVRAPALAFAAGTAFGLGAITFAGGAALHDAQPLAAHATPLAAEAPPAPVVEMAMEVSEAQAPQQATPQPAIEAHDEPEAVQAACTPARSSGRRSSRAPTGRAPSSTGPQPEQIPVRSPEQVTSDFGALAASPARQAAAPSALSAIPGIRPITIAHGMVGRR